jgi:thioredoxin 1
MSELVSGFTVSDLDAAVGGEAPVLVDFWAEWCAPCRMLAPTIDELAREYQGKVVVGKVNVDEQGELAQRYGIRGIPTLLVFKGGEIRERFIGVQPKSVIKKALDAIL